MDPQSGLNRSVVFHPCYRLISSTLAEHRSGICALLDLFLGCLSVVTVCGNILVILSVAYFRQLHTPTNALVLSLAVADLLVGAMVFPLTMEFSVSSCLFNRSLFCKLRSGLDITLSTCSILNLCCISVDRYYAVCEPLRYRSKITARVIVLMVLVSWSIPTLVAVGLVGFNRVKCVQKCFFYIFIGKFFVVCVTFYLPLLLVLCIYLRIFLVAQRQVKSITGKPVAQETLNRTDRKATKTLAIIMGVFLLCWLPSFLCTSILSFSSSSRTGPLVEILNWLALSNSMLNPFIYAFFYSWFRSAFKIIVSGKILFADLTDTKLH